MNVHKTLLYAAYGWLTVLGVLHFLIDVVSQYLRQVHEPGPQATLHYGLHSAYALGQVAFGLFALSLARRHPELLSHSHSMFIALAAAVGWLLVAWLFMEYREPKAVAAIFLVLLTAAAVAR